MRTIIWSLMIQLSKPKPFKRKSMVFIVVGLLAVFVLKLWSMDCAFFHSGPFTPFKNGDILKKPLVVAQQLPS